MNSRAFSICTFILALTSPVTANSECPADDSGVPDLSCSDTSVAGKTGVGTSVAIEGETAEQKLQVTAALSALYQDSAWQPQAKRPELEKCRSAICLAYQAYFAFPADPAKARSSIACIADVKTFIESKLEYTSHQCITRFSEVTRDDISRLIILLHGRSDNEWDIPSRLLLDNPTAVETLNVFGRFPPSVREFEESAVTAKVKEIGALLEYYNEIESGRWATTTYMTWAGSISRDIGAHQRVMEQAMTYAPQLLLGVPAPTDEVACDSSNCLEPLRVWAHLGVWNMEKFEKLKLLFRRAVPELARYYSNNVALNRFAKDAEKILERYTYQRLSVVAGRAKQIAESPEFALFSGPQLTLAEIQTRSKGFTEGNWNEALKFAALHAYPDDVLAWLLASGAKVDSGPESALIYGIRSARVTAFLLAHGADVHRENNFGKTALYYAVQFDALPNVEALLRAGADVNHHLKTAEKLRDVSERKGESVTDTPYEDYLLERVAEFTPLIYALRYASPKVTELLLRHGAVIEPLKVGQFLEWINEENQRGWTEKSVLTALAKSSNLPSP